MDAVDHPSHYNQHSVECIDVIEHMPYNIGAAIKYIWRCGLKEGQDPMTDLHKAIWYAEREIERTAMRSAKNPHGRKPFVWFLRDLREMWRDGITMAGAESYRHPAGIYYQAAFAGFSDEAAGAMTYLWFAAFTVGNDEKFWLNEAIRCIRDLMAVYRDQGKV